MPFGHLRNFLGSQDVLELTQLALKILQCDLPLVATDLNLVNGHVTHDLRNSLRLGLQKRAHAR